MVHNSLSLVLIFTLRVTFSQLLIIIILKHFLFEIVLKVFELYDFYFTEWVAFSADKAIFGQGNIQVEFGRLNSPEIFCLINEVTRLVFNFDYFPQDDGFIVAACDNKMIRVK